MKKKKNSGAKNRLIVFGGLSILAIIYFISSLFNYTVNIKKLKDEELKLNNELAQLKEEAEELKIEIGKLKDPEYIARFAREAFSYSKENGEYVIKLENKEEEIKEEIDDTNNTSKIIIIGIGLALLFIIIYIIKKR